MCFTLTVTGGDRYKGESPNRKGYIYPETYLNTIRSRTYDYPIWKSAPRSRHLEEQGARAVDFAITGIEKSTIHKALPSTDFDYIDDRYPGHIHVNLPNGGKYNGENDIYPVY